MLTAKQLSDKIHAYSPQADTSVVERAYAFAKKAHEGQVRFSGEPYFTHPVATARNLVHMQLDPATIAAGLLHDVPEDTEVTLDEVEAEFGKEIAFLVDGVTKVSKVRLEQSALEAHQAVSDEEVRQAKEAAAIENLRKMFLAMAQDIRVVLIKLADRLHNMETLGAVPEAKQKRIALETMQVYAPLAERLGMGEMKGKLQDLAFPFVDPEGYLWVRDYSVPFYAQADRYLRKVMRLVESDLETHQIDASVHGRAKHLYSLYRKLLASQRDISKVYDLIAVRILVSDVADCYEVLGMLHQRWKPLLGRIKDYIAIPKANGYQSLHTTVFCEDGRIVEFQVRTTQMHEEAENGIAAHWGYKEGVTLAGDKFGWVQQIANWQNEIASNQEFIEALKIDTFEHRIFVFTPKGEVKDLPVGATPLDFAYQVHSDIGNHCYGAKINGKLCHLSTELQNGDVVEILLSSKSLPKQDWLDIAVTASAKAHIRKSLREQIESTSAVNTSNGNLTSVIVETSPNEPVARIQKTEPSGEVLVEGRRGYLTHMAKCCNPQLGDSIIGLVSQEQGISVHQRWCKNVRTIADPDKLVRVSWRGADALPRYQLRMEAYDKRGLMREIASMVTDLNSNIIGVRGDSSEDGMVFYSLLVETEDDGSLQRLIAELQQHPNVNLVERQ